MKKYTLPFLITLLLAILLVSCSLGGDTTAETQSALPELQATPALPQVVVELAVQYDTALSLNTVNQTLPLKFVVKMVNNELADETPPNITFSGAAPVCPPINTVGNLDERLDTGEIIECTFDHIISQADLDNGSIPIAASVSVYNAASNQVSINIPTVPSKQIALEKTAAPTTFNSAGQTITYTYTIKNTGKDALGPTQFTVTDTGINNNNPFTCGNADASIAPGENLTCTATYTVTDADISSGSIATDAVASGGGASPSQPAKATLTKSEAPTAAGGSIQHTVRDGEWLWQIARCYGADPNQTVTANSQLADPAQIKEGTVVNIPSPGSKGTVHASPEPCVTKHVVQSGDTWTSIAQKYGADPGLTQRVNGNTLSVGGEVKVPHYTAGLNLPLLSGSSSGTPSTTAFTLSVTASPNSYTQQGQVITLNYVNKNTGTTTLGPTQFTVTEALAGATPFNCGAANITLAPETTVTCSASYTTTQANMDTASFSSSATAAGNRLTSAPASVIISKNATSLTLTTTANPATYSQTGQVITFTYTIKNSGTTTLGPAQFTITDSLITADPFNCGDANAAIEPNSTITCNATHTISDVDMGVPEITSNAVANGGNAPASQTSSVTITKQ